MMLVKCDWCGATEETVVRVGSNCIPVDKSPSDWTKFRGNDVCPQCEKKIMALKKGGD